MDEQLPEKLHKIGEHGVGKHVLAFISDDTITGHLPFKGHISNDWKVHYFHVDLNDDFSSVYKKLINSLNYYHYADTLLFDYPVFLLFLHAIERVAQAHEVIRKIIVFNPMAAETKMVHKVTGLFTPKRYTNLLGNKVTVPKKLLSRFNESFEKLHLMHANEVVVLGLENRAFSLKLAARIKNSKLETIRDYSQAVEAIIEEFH